MAEMLDLVREALGNYHYLFLYGAGLVLLLILMKGRRKSFVIPVILLTAGILNPVFCRLWNKVNDYAYWRTLWMVPVVPVCAAVPAVLLEKEKKTLLKAVTILAALGVFVLAGTWIGQHSLTRFEKPANADKLPGRAQAVGDVLLELDEEPYVVSDDDVCIYLRQYSGKIHCMYARDVYFGESGDLAAGIFEELTAPDGDLQEVAQTMLNYDYEYLTAKNPDEERKAALVEAGFEPVGQAREYEIYRVTGKPTEELTYNDKHQVIARTCVDENGDPVTGPEGYVTRTYDYNINGGIIRRFQTDAEGRGVPDSSGKAGYERTFDRFGHITEEIWLGADGDPVNVGGYAIRRSEFKRERKVSESWFDTDGDPAVISPGYTHCVFEYTKDGQLSLIRYYDAQDRQAEAGSAFFHEYLQSLAGSLDGKNISVFISAKDEASKQMTVTLAEDLRSLGIQTDLRGQYRKSFYAVVTPEGTKEELGDDVLACSGSVSGTPYTVTSAGHDAGSASSIVIGGEEYSKNKRGLNIVVFDNKTQEVVESVAFDTFSQNMKVTR